MHLLLHSAAYSCSPRPARHGSPSEAQLKSHLPEEVFPELRGQGPRLGHSGLSQLMGRLSPVVEHVSYVDGSWLFLSLFPNKSMSLLIEDIRFPRFSSS